MFLIVVIVATIAFVVIAESYTREAVLSNYNIEISSSDSLKFVTKEGVEEWLYSEDCAAPIGVSVDNVDVRAIESFLSRQSFVTKANVSVDIFGTLFVVIEQAEPVFRIFDENGESFYIDKNKRGHYSKAAFVKDVAVLTCDTLLSAEIKKGCFFDKKDEKNYFFLDKLFNFVKWVSTDKFWNSQIAGINIVSNGKVEIYPRVGDHKIVLCNFEDLDFYENYFRKLTFFYDKQMAKSGWGTYALIDLSYDNMIVCKINSNLN